MREIGGQAVMEGIMLSDKNNVVVAVQDKKKIIVKKEKRNSLAKKYKFLAWPFLRGVVGLFEMLVIGMRALSWSASIVSDEEEELTKRDIAFVIASAMFLSIGLFIGLPFLLTKLVSKDNGVLFNLIDGAFRVLIFFIYVLVISLFKDVKVLFQYHGAEHKVVNCYESGEKVNLKNAKKFSTLHKRCGSSFLMIVMFISVILFSLISDPRWYVKLGSRIVLIPIVAGVSYEILKFTSKYNKNIISRILIAPGLLFQKITTSEPTEAQLKVALRSFKEL